MKNLSV